jgi:hypothetical protein
MFFLLVNFLANFKIWSFPIYLQSPDFLQVKHYFKLIFLYCKGQERITMAALRPFSKSLSLSENLLELESLKITLG